MERENKVLVTEVNSLKHQVDRIRVEKDGIGEDLARTQALLMREHNQLLMVQENKDREEEDWRKEKLANRRLVQEKTEEVNILRCEIITAQSVQVINLRAAVAKQSETEAWKDAETGMEVSEVVTAHVREKETEIRKVRAENRSKLGVNAMKNYRTNNRKKDKHKF